MNKPNFLFTLLASLLLVLALVTPPARAAVIEAWVQRYNGPRNGIDNPRAVVVDRSGNVILTGWSKGNNGPADCDDCFYDYYTAKYSQNGALLWSKRYNGIGNSTDQANALAVDATGNVIVTGFSRGPESPIDGSQMEDLYTAKYAAANGALLWEKRYTNGTGSAVAVDTDGNVVVTGTSRGIDNADFYTAKYAAANGALLWERRYDRARDDRAIAVALDANGNVVVTGIQNNSDYYTAKYAAADGVLLWERHYNGPGNGQDIPAAIVVDANGDVVVAGGTFANGNTDLYTAKYAAGDGALLWEKRYNGPANGSDSANAVAVDDSGNIVVTGRYFPDSLSGNDYYTAKYAAADGALIWERRYGNATNGSDGASAVAVDGNDNVVVTGSSVSVSNGFPINASDYYTAKYAAADGALLWERRYNGPANGSDIVNSRSALALGPNGMVVVAGRSQSVSNNLNSDDFAIVVYRELVPPMITCPVNVVTNCSGGGGTVVNFTVTATDDGDLPPTLTCVPASGSVFPLGQTTVTCTATDTDGLSSTCSFIVTVADSTPPIISCPSNFIVAFASEAGAAVTYSVVATDICDASPALTCAPLSGDTFPIGTTTVTCTASDVNGNSASCSFTVTVLGSRGVDESVLTELIALRSSVTDPNNGRKLDQAIKHLTKSTAAELWRDETHLEGNGRRVFREDAFTIRKLCTLIKGGQSQIPVAMLQGLVDRILQADRLLAFIAIQDAIAAGASSKKIDQAQKFLAKGDAAVGDEKCHNGVEHYRNAWKRAAR